MNASRASSSLSQFNPQTHSEKTPEKLLANQVFDKIRPLLCSIKTSWGESSGFSINNNGRVITVAHNTPTEDVAGKIQLASSHIQLNFAGQDKPFFPEPSAGIVHEHAKALDLYSMEGLPQLSEQDVIPILPKEIQLSEGVKVYFGGYPLGQDTATFHRGTISSITEEQGIRRFTIDGTVVPGNSGGPVVVQHQGKVYLAGVITSEVADFSPEDQKTIAIMKALSDAKKKEPTKPSVIRVSSGSSVTSIGSDGTTSEVLINTPQGAEKVLINDREMVSLSLDLIQRNLSTGIGKAIDIRHYHHLFEETPKIEATARNSFPVAKGKGLVSGSLTEQDGEKRTIAKYLEVRYGNTGRGNRGIHLTLCAPIGKGNYTYKFSPNPHNAPGNYNKNQEELYQKGAIIIVNEMINKRRIPPSLDFEACETTYKATLE